MSEENSKGIWIITNDTQTEGGKDGYDTGANYDSQEPSQPTSRRRTLIRAEDLKHQMSAFLEVVEEVFEQTQVQAQEAKSKMRLDEIELSVEINGEGQVSLFGTGGKVGGKGAINLKFKRQE